MSYCTVKGCVKLEKARGLCSMHYARSAAGKPMLAPNKRALSYDALFDTNIAPPDANGCRHWIGGKDADGYGLFTGKGKATVRAHRYAFERVYGAAGESLVCHHCDNPGCVEPSHLFKGTANDNSQDMVGKGRSPRGERNVKAKLTEAQVLEIRASKEATAVLSRRYRVSIAAITKARMGDLWRHVPGAKQ